MDLTGITAKKQDLEAALEAAAAKTGAHNFEDCHDAIEKHRKLIGLADASPSPEGKAMFLKEANKIPRADLDQQMAGYQLLQRVNDGSHGAPHWDELGSRIDSMIAALRAEK